MAFVGYILGSFAVVDFSCSLLGLIETDLETGVGILGSIFKFVEESMTNSRPNITSFVGIVRESLLDLL